MKSPGSYVGEIIGMIIVGALFAVIGFDIHKDLTVIDTQVETIDGKIYECIGAHSYSNGMTYIDKPYYIEFPTREIKIIKRIDI